MKAVVAGHVAIDNVITVEGEALSLGGPPSYICSISKALDLDIKIITRIGNDFPGNYVEEFKKWGFDITKWICGHPTTRFVLDYTSNPRKMSIDAVCEPITFPNQHYDSILFSPIVGEITKEQVQSINSDFIALDPQGMIREVNPLGEVILKLWTPETLEDIDLFKTSDEEHAYITGEQNPERSLKLLSKKGVKVAVITQGSMGSLVKSGDAVIRIPVYPSKILDTTGAGDCYLAGASSILIDGGSVEWACAYGSALSSAIIETKGPSLELTCKEVIERAEWVYEKIEKR